MTQPSSNNSAAPEAPPRGASVYAVDSHSLIFQVFHAIPEMTSPRGEPVAAVYGFARDMLYLLEEKRPDILICAFDPPGDTFRHEIFPQYKGDRGSMPDELRSQIPKIRELVEALGVPVVSVPTYEADDVLATIARVCDENDCQCQIVTGDKDCRQLISDRVSVYNIRKNQAMDAAGLLLEWGVKPEQVVDFQALVGDKVDSIPGVPLIGPKIAGTLLTEYGTLERVLAAAEGMKPSKRRQNLLEYRDQALLSRELVRLEVNVPLDIDWQTARADRIDYHRLRELFAEFGFRSLGERVTALANEPAIAKSDWDADYQLVDSVEKLHALVQELKQQTEISIDTETSDRRPRLARLVGISIAWRPGEAYYLPVCGPAGERVLSCEQALEALRPVLEDPNVKKIGQNLKYDIIVLRQAGVRLAGAAFDTMIASYLLDAGERSHGLDYLAERYLGHTTIKIEELIGKGKKQKCMDEAPVADVCVYAAEDADIPLRLKPLLEDRLERDELTSLNDDLETPLIEVLADMEHHGIRVDVPRLKELSQKFSDRLVTLEKEIQDLAGHPFNIASPKQLGEVLFEELQLPVVKKTKTGPSTDAAVLEQLASQHPLPKLIVEYRQFSKLKGTYVDALPELVHPESGRVHCSFNQVVAATGRLSCSDPNLQNIPIRSPEGREIRSAFTACEPGWRLLTADYSQIELRVLAHFSSDETLCRAFAEERDVHTLVASQVHNVGLDEVTSDMRRGAKAVNFGIIYGQSPFGLARSLGISKDEAARFIADYFARYPGVADFMHDTLQGCHERGYVETLLGRRRVVTGVRPPPAPVGGRLFGDRPAPMQLNLPERTAVNTVIQGTAADLIKLAMLAVHRALQDRQLRSRMILQIHDELVFDAPEEEIAELAELVRENMQNIATLQVPLRVDVKSGFTWAECEALP